MKRRAKRDFHPGVVVAAKDKQIGWSEYVEQETESERRELSVVRKRGTETEGEKKVVRSQDYHTHSMLSVPLIKIYESWREFPPETMSLLQFLHHTVLQS